MTRAELIQRFALKQPHLSERDVELAVKMMLDQMAACLADGGRIEIRGFACFSVPFPPRAARTQGELDCEDPIRRTRTPMNTLRAVSCVV